MLRVLADERYKTITTEVKRYLQGHYGAAPGTVDEELRRRAIGGEEVITSRPADLLSDELDTLRNEIGDLALSEEDVLTYAMFPDLGKTFLTQRRDGTLEAEALLPPQSSGRVDGGSAAVASASSTSTASFRVAVTGTGQKSSGKRNFYLTLDGVPEEVVVEPLNNYVAGQGRSAGHQRGGGCGYHHARQYRRRARGGRGYGGGRAAVLIIEAENGDGASGPSAAP